MRRTLDALQHVREAWVRCDKLVGRSQRRFGVRYGVLPIITTPACLQQREAWLRST